jgi:DUF1680 family protein
MNTSTVWPSATATTRLRPLEASDVDVTDGFWAQRLRLNRERTIPHGFDQLQLSGALGNLRLAGGTEGSYRAFADDAGVMLPFLDSDVYKWLEAVGWELGRAPDEHLAAAADEAISVIAAAQRPDGYVNSFVQVLRDGMPHRDLAWGHEFYCLGHLIQAAVAWHRAVGDDRLLDIAVRAADRVDQEFGPDGRDGVDGHPGVEMALVELTRVTGEKRYLTLAARMLDLRGKGLLGAGRYGAAYWQDHATVRQATSVAGHSVRALYLDSGVVDVAVELGDEDLLAASQRRWHDLMRTRTYLTGGMGSRHRDEAFGDPYELPPDRAYAETCAAIASVMLAWRLLLATGDAEYADAIERAMYNGVLSGIALSGDRFYYTNPLQRRTHRTYEAAGHGPRAPWYACACCPPNLMRLLASWRQYLATADESGVQLHQYATATIAANPTAGRVQLSTLTAYPWQGRVTVHIDQTPDRPWTLSLRVPAWCGSATLTTPDGATAPARPGTVTLTRDWRAGDTVVLDLDLPVRVTTPDRRVDAVRGCVAVERGPLVYCLESVDAPAAAELEDLAWDPARSPVAVPRPDLADDLVGIDVPVINHGAPAADGDLVAGAVPYFAWANRRVEGMRVWIPR